VAVFQGSWALGQLWLFWLAPIVGALLAGALSRVLHGMADAQLEPPVTGKA